MVRQVALSLLLVGVVAPLGQAQTGAPVADGPPAVTAPTAPAAPQRGYRDPLPTDPADPNYHAGAYHSIVRHNPLPTRPAPRPSMTNSSDYRSEGQSRGQTSGSLNRQSGGRFSTGGVGVNAEYYDSRTLEAGENAHQAPVGRFDSGGGPDRSEQLAARQVGIQRSQSIQNTINAYGTPYAAFGAGYGYGLGLGGGRLYAYPY